VATLVVELGLASCFGNVDDDDDDDEQLAVAFDSLKQRAGAPAKSI
jgi:hypothetical protein